MTKIHPWKSKFHAFPIWVFKLHFGFSYKALKNIYHQSVFKNSNRGNKEAMEEGLNKRANKEVPTNFLVKIMETILKNNIFEFHEGYYKQNIGAAMGSKPILPYANIFMAKIDRLLKNSKGAEALLILKRFLDDYFFIFNGSTKELHALFVEWNKLHKTIKFTMSHTTIKNEPFKDKCDCEEAFEIPFLDVSCTIKEGKIHIDLYKKKTDKNTYLLPSSCHPKQIVKSIPFSLGLRIVRICSSKEDRDKRLLEMKTSLLARGH